MNRLRHHDRASYQPKSSGMLSGGGTHSFHPRVGVIKQNRGGRHALKNFPDVHISDIWTLKKLVPDYNPDLTYSKRELVLLTEKILLTDPKPSSQYPCWLNGRQYIQRLKREVYCMGGKPDPSIVSGLYWRTHPQGRSVNDEKYRKRNDASFYR